MSSITMLGGITVFSIGSAILFRLLRKYPLIPANSNTIFFLIFTATLLTSQSLVSDRLLSGSFAIEHQPDLTPYYLIFHGVLIGWLFVQDILPESYRIPVYLPVLFLFSSNLYITSFFAAEYGVAYPILYAQALWLFGAVLFNRKKNKGASLLPAPASVMVPFGLYLFALALSGLFSYSPDKSYDQFLQTACFGLLPFLMAVIIQSRKAWQATAGVLIITAGIPWLWLGLVKFWQLASQFDWQVAVGYRLFLSGVGPNWVAYIPATLLPLTIALCVTRRKMTARIIWGLSAVGLLLLLAYAQSGQGLSGWLGLTAALLTCGVLILALWRRSVVKLAWLLLPAGAALFTAFILFGSPLLQRMNSSSFYTRIYGWQTLLQSAANNPLVGTGLATRFPAARYGDMVTWSETGATTQWLASERQTMLLKQLQLTFHAHNLFLEIAVGAGLPALLLFLLYLFALAQLGWKTFQKANLRDRILIAGCIAGIAASLGWGMIDVMDYSPPFFTFPVWALIGLLLASPKALLDPDKESG